jgi:hypothetical protein
MPQLLLAQDADVEPDEEAVRELAARMARLNVPLHASTFTNLQPLDAQDDAPAPTRCALRPLALLSPCSPAASPPPPHTPISHHPTQLVCSLKQQERGLAGVKDNGQALLQTATDFPVLLRWVSLLSPQHDTDGVVQFCYSTATAQLSVKSLIAAP